MTAEPTAEAPPVPARPSRVRQVVAGLLTLAVLVFVFLGVFPKFADYSEAWSAIQQMSIASLAVLVLVTLVNIVVYVLPYPAALSGLAYWPAFMVRQTSFMISNVVPAGGAFGLGVQYAMLSDVGYGPAPTTSTIGVTSVWNLLVTLGLPVFALVGLLVTGEASARLVGAAVVGVVVLVVMVAGLGLIVRSVSFSRRLGGWGDSLMGWFRRRRGTEAPAPAPVLSEPAPGEQPGDGDMTAGILRFRYQVHDVVAQRWHVVTAANVAQQLCQFLILAVAVYAIAGESAGVSPVEVFAAFSFARLAGFIPVTPGGLGTVDAALVALLSGFGASNEVALAADLVWRAASYFPQVFIGVVTMVVWQHRRSRGPRPNPAA